MSRRRVSKPSPLVSVVITNFNGKEYLSRCLRSVFRSSFRDFEVVLVDDASTDDSISLARKKNLSAKKFCLIVNEKNYGATCSRNIGIQNSKGRYVLLLENDTQIQPNTILELLECMKTDRNVVAVQPIILYAEKGIRNKIQSSGFKILPYIAWPVALDRMHLFKRSPADRKSIGGSPTCLLIKRSSFRRIGLLDQHIGYPFDDVDINLRIYLMGGKVVRSARSFIYHYAKSFSKHKKIYGTNYEALYLNTSKSLGIMFKYYEFRNLVKYFPIGYFLLLLRALRFLLVDKNISGMKGFFKFNMWLFMNMNYLLKERRKYQRERIKSDTEIFKIISINLPIIESIRRHLFY